MAILPRSCFSLPDLQRKLSFGFGQPLRRSQTELDAVMEARMEEQIYSKDGIPVIEWVAAPVATLSASERSKRASESMRTSR